MVWGELYDSEPEANHGLFRWLALAVCWCASTNDDGALADPVQGRCRCTVLILIGGGCAREVEWILTESCNLLTSITWRLRR